MFANASPANDAASQQSLQRDRGLAEAHHRKAALQKPQHWTRAEHSFNDKVDTRVPSTFFGKATSMVGNALKSFAGELTSALKKAGLDDSAVPAIFQTVSDQVLDALKSGKDIVANIMMSVMSQTTYSDGKSVSQTFELTTKALQVEINHSTGEVTIDSADVSLEIAQKVELDKAGLPTVEIGDLPSAAVDLMDQIQRYLGDLVQSATPSEPDAAETGSAGAGLSPLGDPLAKVSITMMEHFMNENEDRISRFRLDYSIKLTAPTDQPDASDGSDAAPDAAPPPAAAATGLSLVA